MSNPAAPQAGSSELARLRERIEQKGGDPASGVAGSRTRRGIEWFESDTE